MGMTVSELNTIKSLMLNEMKYSQIKEAEDKFLDKPILTEGETSTVQRETLKSNIDRQRREDEFLFGK